jgi:4,5-dihydroxyphthalate decarboxylase
MGLAMTLLMKDYDFIAPIAAGDVKPEGVDLTLVRDTAGALDRTLNDPSVQAGELSFSRHIHRLAAGDHSFVGIPVFPTRLYRHRCFFILRDSGLRGFTDLARKRIGTNEWPASGNTWSRALLRDAGVTLEDIQWWVGTVDGKASQRPQGNLPPHVRPAPPNRTLREMLEDRELDALMCPVPPKDFYAPGSPIVRLIPNFREVEQEYARRTGISQVQHIVGVRREVYDRHPRILKSLYDMLEKSKLRWQASRRDLTDTLPWTLADIEESTGLFGQDWHPSGLGPNRKSIEVFLQEQVVQGLITRRLSADELFPEFQQMATA